MPYYFECSTCNRQIDYRPGDELLDRNCDGCGGDMCVECITDNPDQLCNFCAERDARVAEGECSI